MRYSTLLLAALPMAYAAPVITSIVYDYVTVTIDQDGQIVTSSVLVPVPTASVTAAAVAATSSAAASSVVPSVNVAVPASSSSAPAATASPAQDSSASSSSGACGCPSDPSAPTSPGLGSHPARSVLDSLNCIRRMYNAQATCLQWSPSLATASEACVEAGSESLLRAGSSIVSDNGGYGRTPWYTGALATTDYESSVYTLLCQDPSDPLLAGGCAGRVGEDGCTGGACTGHRDAIIDAAGQFSYTGVGMDLGNGWMSTSLSSSFSA